MAGRERERRRDGWVSKYRRWESLRIRRPRLGQGASVRASAARLRWTVQARRPWALWWLMPWWEGDDAASSQPSAGMGDALERGG